MRRQNNGYFKLFAKNLFSILFEIRKHFLKSFLTSAFLNNFCHKKELLCRNKKLFVCSDRIGNCNNIKAISNKYFNV